MCPAFIACNMSCEDEGGYESEGESAVASSVQGSSEPYIEKKGSDSLPPATVVDFVVDPPKTLKESCFSSGSPAAQWAPIVSEAFGQVRARLGLIDQARNIKLLSVCTGMFTEGLVCEVLICVCITSDRCCNEKVHRLVVHLSSLTCVGR